MRPKPLFPDSELLDRYLRDELNAEDSAMIEQWLASSPDNTRVLNGLRNGLSASSVTLRPYDVESQVEQIVAEADAAKRGRDIGRRVEATLWRERSPLPFFKRPQVLRWIAASAVILSAGGYAALKVSTDAQNSLGSPLTQVTTGYGERSTIELADGTALTLNVGTQIRVRQDFLQTRTIELVGEAYFNVRHSERSPLIVKTGDVRTTVLGTEFAVRAYDTTDVRVAVRNGRVSVAGVVLNANDIASIHNAEHIQVRRNTSVTGALAFANGKLYLSNIPLREAIADLSRWYNVEIVLSDTEIGALPLSVVLPTGAVTDLVDILTLVLPVRATLQGNVLTLTSLRGNIDAE